MCPLHTDVRFAVAAMEQPYQSPLRLFKDATFRFHVVLVVAALAVAACIGVFSTIFCYPTFFSRRKLRRYAKITGLMSMGESTTAGQQMSTQEGKEAAGGAGARRGAVEGVRAADNTAAVAEARAEAAAAAAAAVGAIATLLESDADDAGDDVGAARPLASPPSRARKLSLSERRGAFLDFLASTEYHQTVQGEPLDVEAALRHDDNVGNVSRRGSSAPPMAPRAPTS